MKRLLVAYFLVLLGYSPMLAQTKNSGSLRIKNGSTIADNIPFSDRYLYPKFESGKVMYMNGTLNQGFVNYNMLFGQIQFLDSINDTLLLDKPELIRLITIGDDDIYYFNKKFGHLLFVKEFKNFSLVESKRLAYNGTEKYSAYGQYTSTSAITTYSSIMTGNGANQTLEGNDKLILKHKTIYYLRDKNGKIYTVLRPSFYKLYKGHKHKIMKYFSENPPDFENKVYILNTLSFFEAMEEY